MSNSFSRKDLSVPSLNAGEATFHPDKSLPQEATATGTATDSTRAATKGKVSMMAIFSRYFDDITWLTDPNAGIMDNSTGTPRFIMPIKIYQPSDIGDDGLPIFPGYLPPPPLNLTEQELKATGKNYSNSSTTIMPTWPEWAWDYVIKKNASKAAAPVGSSVAAEVNARRKAGLPEEVPMTNEEWRHYESLDWWGDARKNNPVKPRNETKLPSKEKVIAAFRAENRSTTLIYPEINPVLPLRIIPNRGSESISYITAIIDHYDDLPDIMLFMHGHRFSWHTLLAQDWTLRRLATHPPTDPSFTSTNGYHALGCLERWRNDISQLFPTEIDANWNSNNGPRWHESLAARFVQAWSEHLGEAYQLPLPEYVRVPTAASFAASKQAILRRPKAFYEDMREWLLKTNIENKWLGIVMEFQVGIMIANTSHFSVSQERCLCDLYSVCSSKAEI